MMRPYLWITLLCLCLAPGARADDTSALDPKARQALADMVKAYREVRTLDQETTYSNITGTTLGRLVRARLIVQRPNRLLLEVVQRTPEQAQPVLSKFHCDGKEFFTYQEIQGWYTKERAPKDFRGFAEICMSIEMNALTGADPFAGLEKQARAMRMESPVIVDNVMTDVALVDLGSEERTGEARFYIGQQDHLLRRFTFESKEIPKPEPEKPKEPAPPLAPDEEPVEPPLPPRPVRFGYDNRVLVNQPLAKDAFMWIAPAGAMLLNTPNSGVLASKNRKGPPGYLFGKTLDLSKAAKTVHAKDLVNKANKQRR